MTAHAKLSASGSAKWLVCTPSANLEATLPDEGSEFASQGTFAHAVFEQAILLLLDRPAELLPMELIHHDTAELREYVAEAVNVAWDRIHDAYTRCKDPIILVEQRLDFSMWVPEGFGTGDLVIITDGLVEVMDLKYGKGIYVDPVQNSQLRLYGLGAYYELCHLYDIRRVRMTVLQPRLSNFRSEELSIAELLQWGEKEVVPRAKAAWVGAGDFVPGDHCRDGFCRARFTCAARAQMAIEVIQAEFSSPLPPTVETLSMDRIAALLPQADIVIDWFNDLKAHALKQAVEHNTTVPGFKLVEGRSNRKYVDHDAVAAKLKDSGIPEEIMFERSLLGITAMESAIGKKKFTELLGDLVVKPSGKPTLVPEGDKRPALALTVCSVEDFKSAI